MLQLVFDRTIGYNKKLPDSTLVIAAANYKQNIPVFFNIMAPILNRFCLVNLQYESSKAFLDEFLQDENQRVKDIVVYQKTELTQEKKDALKDGLKKLFTTIFDSFEENKNENGSALDINNQMLNNIYESDTRFVYNFITGRTLYYLYKIMLSFLRFGMTIERHETIMINMVFGLAGLGMNSFSEMQQKTYLKSLETLWKRLYALLQENPAINEKKGVPNLELDFSGKTTAEAVNLWILYNESDVFSKDNEKHLDLLLRHIEKCYGLEKEKVEIVKQSLTSGSDQVFNFVDDMQRLDYLLDVLSKNNDTKIKNDLRLIQEAYKELKEDMLNSMLK
ncbi:hypothetical protein AGMMS50212_04510 [Spirochaetia bacterium]|nr:hypothetical protein AGMMS50212_04510 [Spirochaetia bacterium]